MHMLLFKCANLRSSQGYPGPVGKLYGPVRSLYPVADSEDLIEKAGSARPRVSGHRMSGRCTMPGYRKVL